MITNDYSQDLVAPDELMIPRRGYHKLYVKQSKIKHVLFALFIVAMLIAASILLNS
jgi:hypothetical protein